MGGYLRFLKEAVHVTDLSRTDLEILKALYEGKHLLISEIVERIKRSERHIRERLKILQENGFLKKDIEVLNNKRLAYRYSLRSVDNIGREIQIKLFKKIDAIDKLMYEGG
jgi:DNA-binding Lrp family transcriptional regulator